MHLTWDQGLFDLALILIGFLGRSLVQFRLPAMVICLILDMARWYMKTHPHGQEMSNCTDINERLKKLYPEAEG